MSINEQKRRRLKNTTAQQYEMYLEAIENDFALKSNTIKPTLGPNYLKNKWEELTIKLNAIGQGPALSADEWKKRFADWRYATKGKYRKMYTDRIKTGGGPAIDIKVSPLEERALSAWGMITVEGNTMVTPYEGIPLNNEIDETIQHEAVPQKEVASNIQEDEEEKEEPAETFIISVENSTPTTLRKRIRPKPLSMLAENLMDVTKNNNIVSEKLITQLKEFSESYINIEEKKHELEKKKLDFKIKKFQFLHPDFKM